MNLPEVAALNEALRRRNLALARDCSTLEAALSSVSIPALLDPYRQKMIGLCVHFKREAEMNIALLGLKSDSLLEDVLSKTRVATYYLRLLSSRLASPIIRCSESDQLCLKILTWVHRSHTETASLPAAFVDGDVAIWPFMDVAPVYFFPFMEQSGLLHQPLHFHEFGHGLYRLHKLEMDALVKEMQQSVSDILVPLSQRNDRQSHALDARREVVVNRWFDWAQEFFCDAVGLVIGGPAYLYAFASYSSSLSQSDFYLPGPELEKSKHPVTLLRVRLLVRRARELDLNDAATRVEDEWNMLGRAMKVSEDHHGFYEESMADDVHRILSDMLVEANPRAFLGQEIAPDRNAVATDSPVLLLNRAWNIQHSNYDGYADWERHAVQTYLG